MKRFGPDLAIPNPAEFARIGVPESITVLIAVTDVPVSLSGVSGSVRYIRVLVGVIY